MQQTGWVATNSPITITPTSGTNITGEDLGDFRGSHQRPGLQRRRRQRHVPAGDPGLPGWTIDLLNSRRQRGRQRPDRRERQLYAHGRRAGQLYRRGSSPNGYVQTTSPASFNVTVVAGQNDSGLTFGDFQLATVSGEVFDDVNDDGALDAGDPGLAGWTVQLLNSLNKVVSTTTTDSNGNYSFNDVGPGIYSIAAVAQPGYIQTDPSSGPITITATSGASLGGQDFGEFKSVSLAVSDLRTTPASGLQSGMALVVQWTDTNTGTQPASGRSAIRS